MIRVVRGFESHRPTMLTAQEIIDRRNRWVTAPFPKACIVEGCERVTDSVYCDGFHPSPFGDKGSTHGD